MVCNKVVHAETFAAVRETRAYVREIYHGSDTRFLRLARKMYKSLTRASCV